MADLVEHLIVGAGRAAASAVEELVSQGAGERTTVIGAERHLPYDRPPLSKGYLLGRDDRASLEIEGADFYRHSGVQLILGHRATQVDARARVVQLDDGRTIAFQKLLIATGARLRQLDLPGSQLAGLHYLRTIDDSDAIRAEARSSRRAVVVGTGFIGMEVAAALREMGLEVTVLDRVHVLYGRFLSPEISDFFAELYRQHGVRILHGTAPVEFRGHERVQAVVTEAGEVLDCDMAVIGVGVAPEVEFLKNSGMTPDNGVVVDAQLQTSVPGIFVAGDVANFWDPVFGKRRRIEHWDTAKQHGRLAARNMLGLHETYDAVSYFFSDVFDVSFDFIGDTEGCDQTVLRGDTASRSFAVFYLRAGRPRAGFFLGRPARERRAAEILIRKSIDLSGAEAQLRDPAVSLTKLVP